MRQNLSERVALAIQIEMLRQNLSKSDLAAKLDETYLWVHRRIRRQTPFLLDDVQRFADALDVPLSQLITDREVSAA